MVFRRGRRARSNFVPTTPQENETHQETLHRLANLGQFDAILTLVMNSTPEDWSSCVPPHQPADDVSAVDSVVDVDVSKEDSSAALSSDPATTPLHLILAYQPPVSVVDSMIHIVHEKFCILSPEEYPNKAEQKTPLHIAVENFCDPEVIERLLSGESLLVPALLRDHLDRCALHYNCCTIIDKRKKKSFFDRDPVAMDQFRQRQTLSILLEHYPEAAGLTDVNGKTPWDYAQDMKMEGTVVRNLKKMYDIFALKPSKKFVKQTTASTTMDISDSSDYVFDDDDEDLCADELPLDLRSLNCSRHWMDEIDDYVSSVGDYEAEMYNTESIDDSDS